MSRRFLTPVSFPSLSSDPVSGDVGSVFYDTVVKALKYYDGTSWKLISAGGPSYILIDGGTASSQYNSSLDGGGA